MSVATTTVYLYIGLDNERRAAHAWLWPETDGGHIELVNGLELWAERLEELYAAEFKDLCFDCVFDYEVTEELGAWLFKNWGATEKAFNKEARRLVALHTGE